MTVVLSRVCARQLLEGADLDGRDRTGWSELDGRGHEAVAPNFDAAFGHRSASITRVYGRRDGLSSTHAWTYARCVTVPLMS
jgi:hypothetical protein